MATKKKSQTNPEWAVEAWRVLVKQAQERRETITYSDLAKEMGHGTSRLGKVLEHILAYCQRHDLPLLSVLAVRKDTGAPDPAMDPYPAGEDERVYAFDWAKVPMPTADGFTDAMSPLPEPPVYRQFKHISGQIAPFKRSESADDPAPDA